MGHGLVVARRFELRWIYHRATIKDHCPQVLDIVRRSKCAAEGVDA